MKPAYEYTWQEYENLGVEFRFLLTDDAGGAKPYHSNYHLCSIIAALQTGKIVSNRVLQSYGVWTYDAVFLPAIAYYDKYGN
jgi:hypothetical protein